MADCTHIALKEWTLCKEKTARKISERRLTLETFFQKSVWSIVLAFQPA
jgi:hypothetical protein